MSPVAASTYTLSGASIPSVAVHLEPSADAAGGVAAGAVSAGFAGVSLLADGPHAVTVMLRASRRIPNKVDFIVPPVKTVYFEISIMSAYVRIRPRSTPSTT